MIDSHCHLAGTEFVADLDAVVVRAKEAGLVRCLVILAAEDDQELAQGRRVVDRWDAVRVSIGVHPHQAHKFADEPEEAARVTAKQLDAFPQACAIGEIGLDYHYDFSPPEVQHAVFRAQLRLARARKLPVVIHTREAEDDTLQVIAEESQGELGGVFHCFTGTRTSAARALDIGFHVSVPGIVTFPKAAELRDAVREVPEERLLIETDSPYLAPVPFRGKRNEPAYVVKVLEALAALRDQETSQLGARLVENYDRLFGSS